MEHKHKVHKNNQEKNGKVIGPMLSSPQMATVLLCTAEPVLAEGLSKVFESRQPQPDQDLQMVGWCAGPDPLRAEMEKHRPDLLLADLTAAVNFSVLSSLHELAGETKIILWVHDISTELALQSMSLGIRGILRKSLPLESLYRCLLRVHEGELWFEKALTDSLMTARRYSLTRREGQLVALLSQGLKNKEIATALSISEGTVKVYLSRLFQKLGVKDRFELALYGLKNLSSGMHTPEEPKRDSTDTDVQARKPVSAWQAPRSFFVDRAPVKPATTTRGPFTY
ncbi:MAG TPA: response regulator transcription factor [Bryobacteraceae bacterium]|nr:response regulator transcription factor [Bryobacteraceae bacterium]